MIKAIFKLFIVLSIAIWAMNVNSGECVAKIDRKPIDYKTVASLRVDYINLRDESAARFCIKRALANVEVKSVNTLAFGLGGLLAGLSGVLAGPFIAIFPTMGLNVLIIAFIVVIVGGLGDMFGAVVAGLMLGFVENVMSIFVEPTYAKVIALLFVTSFLFFRPNGIFGRGR